MKPSARRDRLATWPHTAFLLIGAALALTWLCTLKQQLALIAAFARVSLP